MNYTQLFYWLTVADNARTLFSWGAGIFTVIAVASTLVAFLSDDGPTGVKKWIWWSYPFMFLWWALLVFTPSKKDALLIVAGGQTMNFLTTDSSAKQIPQELSSFVLTELKNMAAEAKIDLNIADQKEKILNEAKNMTAAELIQKMNADTTFAKIVLNK